MTKKISLLPFTLFSILLIMSCSQNVSVANDSGVYTVKKDNSNPEIAAKFVRRASTAGDEYKQGVSRASDWQQNTAAASGNYESGVQAAISNGSFQKGVAKVSNEQWRQKAITKGGANYGTGVRLAETDYASGYAPFRAVVESVTLPPRGPKGSPENYERVRAIVEAQHKAKVSN